MIFDDLKQKALSLPLKPGVYIMRDKNDTVIYVGKAKKLKNRVSQYFQDTASHSPKTRLMVSKVHSFEVIVAASEFEALVLECSLIKRYMPKYNILLKDDKGYPFLRLDMREDYPRITLVNKTARDGAEYFGPFGSRGVTQGVANAVCEALKLPDCKKQFPDEIGRGRPCLNYHMNRCIGWCQPQKSQQEYRALMEQARQLLQGNYKATAEAIKRDMLAAAEVLDFELAAALRDRLQAVEKLSQKQFVTAGALADTDVIGYAETESRAAMAVLHFSGGNLLDKEYEVFSLPDDRKEAVQSLLQQFYLSRGSLPKRILLPFVLEDGDLMAQLLQQQTGQGVKLLVPQRGDNLRLVELACSNAREEAQRVTSGKEKYLAVVNTLGKMLAIAPPLRIESFDISNISGTDMVSSMVVFVGGKAAKSQYKKFKIQGLPGQDDYAAMRQTLLRRFSHYLAGDKGFAETPDLLLIDGGIAHAATALEVLRSLKLDFPVFGMVKDDRHRTRALVTPEGQEIRIDNNQAIFSFIGNIQEETHRFAVGYHKKLRSKRLRYSELDNIAGVGPKRKQELLKKYGSLSAIGQASLPELERMLPKNAAAAVFSHFHPQEET